MPTRSGVVLCLLAIGIGAAAYNTSSNILYLTLALMLSSLLLSGVLSWHNFRGTAWRLLLEPHMRVGQTSPVRLQVQNRKARLPSYGLWFNLVANTNGARVQLPIQGALEPQGEQVLEWLFTPMQRGREAIEMSELESLFPFGFLRKSITGGGPVESALVWPRRVDYTFAPTARGSYRRQGERARRRGQGAELIGLRNYRQGDLLRQVHWKATARLRRLLVRETAEEQNETYALWVGPHAGDWRDAAQFERLCAAAGSLAEDLFVAGALAEAGVAGGGFIQMRRLADLHQFLDALATLEPQEGDCRPPATFNRLILFRPLGDPGVRILVAGHDAGTA